MLVNRASNGYTVGMKDSGLRIRVEKELREKFLELCREQDKPAAQVIREFMRQYIAENDDGWTAPAHTKKKKSV